MQEFQNTALNATGELTVNLANKERQRGWRSGRISAFQPQGPGFESLLHSSPASWFENVAYFEKYRLCVTYFYLCRCQRATLVKVTLNVFIVVIIVTIMIKVMVTTSCYLKGILQKTQQLLLMFSFTTQLLHLCPSSLKKVDLKLSGKGKVSPRKGD